VLDNESCLDWRNVKKGAAEMNEREKSVVGQVLMFGIAK
jgi:hypothetical protein